MRHLLTLLTCLILLAADAPTTSPAYRFDVTKPADALTVREEKDRTVFLITSPSGIGSATITPTAGQWPTRAVVRFLYTADRGFQRLEGIDATTNRQERAVPLEKAALHDGAMELPLSPELLNGATHVKLSWVDAYR